MWRLWVRRGGCIGSWWGNRRERDKLGRPRRRWVDNIRMDLQEVGCGYMDWIGLAQDRDRWRTLVSAVMNLRVSWNLGNFLTSCKPVSFSRRTLHYGVSKYVQCVCVCAENQRLFPYYSTYFIKFSVSRKLQYQRKYQMEGKQLVPHLHITRSTHTETYIRSLLKC